MSFWDSLIGLFLASKQLLLRPGANARSFNVVELRMHTFTVLQDLLE